MKQNRKPENKSRDGNAEVKRPRSRVRIANAVVALVLVVFFFAHAALGVASGVMGWRGALALLVWLGVALIVVHVVLSVATTYTMFTDTVRPPSRRKRGHQWLKWASGVVLALLAVVHVVAAPMVGESHVLPIVVAALLIAALAWHVCVGVKSLTRDLSLPKRARMPIRIVLVAVAVIIAAVLIVASCMR